ncbi:MAG: hypothetical protein SGJ00_15005, partial [bacterium]|nr:hypothetical protein [bacterium]
PATSYPTPVNQEPVTPAPITPAPITKALEIPTSQIPRTNAQETQIPVNPATSYPTPVNPTPVNQPPITKAQEIPTSQIPRTNAQETQPTEVNHPIEININKATENKRIQYTVMPPIEEPKTVPLNATFEGKELSYNDKIAQVNPPIAIPLAEKTIEAPIDSIKSAINLNKKIAFVNILFHENVVEYAKAIERLNQALDRNDAFRIHNELKHQHNWENSNELVQDLERLIKRRFA